MPNSPEVTFPLATEAALDFLLDDEAWTPESESGESDFASDFETDCDDTPFDSELDSNGSHLHSATEDLTAPIFHIMPGTFPDLTPSEAAGMSMDFDSDISIPFLRKAEVSSACSSDPEYPESIPRRRPRLYGDRKHTFGSQLPKLARKWTLIKPAMKAFVKFCLIALFMSFIFNVGAEGFSYIATHLARIQTERQQRQTVKNLFLTAVSRPMVCTGIFPFNQVCRHETPVDRLFSALSNSKQQWHNLLITSWLLLACPGVQHFVRPSRMAFWYGDYDWPYFTRDYGNFWIDGGFFNREPRFEFLFY